MSKIIHIGFQKTRDVTKELLDTIQITDLIKINDWEEPLEVRGVSENYVVMADENGDEYSVIEKKPFQYNHNNLRKGYFSASTDDRTFGFMDSKLDFSDADIKQYRFEDSEWMQEYLAAFEKGNEDGGIRISERNGIAIESISIKKGDIE